VKVIYFFIFLFLFSCNTVKKEYVCGDHPCIDKKEFNEYFSKNLIIEISKQDTKKNKEVDLVKLNTDSSTKKKKINISEKKNEKILKKKRKEELKAEKIRLKQERKINEAREKDKFNEEIKSAKTSKPKKNKITNISKINNNRVKEKNITNETLVNNVNNNKEVPYKNILIKTSKIKNVKNICDGIKNCDIDKITELLIKEGKSKPFPNISSN
jgi:hypothetical protein